MTIVIASNAWTAVVRCCEDIMWARKSKPCSLVHQVGLRAHWSLRVAPSDVIDAPLGIVLLSLSLDVVVQRGDELQQQSKHHWK